LDLDGATFIHDENTLTLQKHNEQDSYLYINNAGSYNLGSNGILIKGPGEVKIGTDGYGYFIQSGGEFQFSGAMYLGDDPTGVGTYTMTGGSIVAGPDGPGGIVLGEWGGTGQFLQSGGAVNIETLTLARQAGATGNYLLSDGSLTANTQFIGAVASGTFTQSGGTNTTGTLYVGSSRGAEGEVNALQGTGTYTLTGSAYLDVTGNLYVGDGGAGTVNHASGLVFVGGDLIVGKVVSYKDSTASGTGTYNLSGGTLSVTGNTVVGLDANSYGTFNQSGGTHEVEKTLFVDSVAASKGVYNLSGGALNTKNTIVGSFGDGEFNQGAGVTSGLTGGADDGGIHTVAADLVIGQGAYSTGTYNLSGGTLSVTGNTYVGLDANSYGTFNQSGGTHNAEEVLVGYIGTGTYNLSGGTLSVTGNTYVGLDANSYGTFNQSGGLHNVGGTLIVGQAANSWGTYNIYNNGTIGVGGSAIVGQEGTGYFNQSGGTVTVVKDLNLGQAAGSTGAYNLSGDGVVNTGGNLHIGVNGTGVFTQSGDATRVNVTGGVNLSSNNGGTGIGTYNLEGGRLTSAYLLVGSLGTGTFNQSGGSVIVSTVDNKGVLRIGQNSTPVRGNGTYNLSGSSSTTLSTQGTYVGQEGTGVFVQTGGTHTTTGHLTVGFGSTSEGTYTLKNGDLQTNRSYIGHLGKGTFNQENGTHTVSGAGYSNSGKLIIGAQGTYNMTGGTLSVTNEIINNGLFKGAGGNITTNLFTNYGTVAPGNSPGTLTITGNYVQNATGILEIELGGTSTGEFDILNIIGSATLGGILDISLYDGYSPPANGTAFDFLLASEGITGEFSSIAGPKGWVWNVAYLDLIGSDGKIDTARLTANAVPIPAALWLFGAGLLGLIGIRRKIEV